MSDKLIDAARAVLAQIDEWNKSFGNKATVTGTVIDRLRRALSEHEAGAGRATGSMGTVESTRVLREIARRILSQATSTVVTETKLTRQQERELNAAIVQSAADEDELARHARCFPPTPVADEATARMAACAIRPYLIPGQDGDRIVRALMPFVTATPPGTVAVALRWHPASEEPPTKAALLLSFEKTASLPETEVVGYKKSWGFVHPGFVSDGRAITHWAELSPDSHEFYRVLREAKLPPAAAKVPEPSAEEVAAWEVEARQLKEWHATSSLLEKVGIVSGYVAARKAQWVKEQTNGH